LDGGRGGEKGEVVRYSEAFKQQVLRELEEGKLESIEQARRVYRIRGGGTISCWMRKYGKRHLMRKAVRVEKPEEVSELEQLRRRGLRISITEESHCYENAMGERVNGILKQEYELDATYRSKGQAKRGFIQAVELYNDRRPHLSLGYGYPRRHMLGRGWRVPSQGGFAPTALRPPWDSRNRSQKAKVSNGNQDVT